MHAAIISCSNVGIIMEHKQVIILRKDLNMRKGKMVAQGSHASIKAILDRMVKDDTGRRILASDPRIDPWLDGRFKKICVSVNSELELLALRDAAEKAGLVNALILDSGLTEFGGVPTYTALAIGPDAEDRIDVITKDLPLL